ncbi:disease resistance protein L6-like [Rhodamnia argentea]|uniref:Disease resistance protein L6-like n=1 Tax=Rhodamnia argentea TaxID=178133 RepID=A0ABM3HJ64_9MYRT|nr:disease resistance protein L6-like [Rhodamnia argentea]
MERGTNSRASIGPPYEVFLNFQGSDTRHEFTDFLYHGMVDAGIHVFRDSESLHVGNKIGDELLQAIEQSKIYIPIFSRKYASSRWCLRELAHMFESTLRSNENKEILPIFLNVEPLDVKLRTNLYREALSRHQEKFATEVESWENALNEVGEMKGWNWKKGESQVHLLRSVIQTVLAKLNAGCKKNVTEDLVGVDDRVEAIIRLLDVESNGVQFLGIYGMGGVGKTTLAKIVFNQLSSHFQCCNFLSDVRESSERHGLVYLQEKLLSKFLDSGCVNQIHDVDDGINMIKRLLCNRKVLIVLDDVDEKKQLKSLAGKGNWFGYGSRIIITTRDQSVLMIEGEATSEGLATKPANVSTYEVEEMKFDHALKLFSRHAFRRDSPLENYISLSEDMVSTLGKLPLALEVTGSSLSGKSEAFWADTLKKLEKAPPMEIQKTLKITYERLDDAQRQIFLDIACFFVGKDKTYPFYMWDDCEYCPHNAIEVLSLMSLIKIKDDDTFWMHDQVRDLGREIVRQENLKDPCERSRVWNHEEAWSILKGKEGSTKIKALSLGHREGILTGDEVANLQKLRFFHGESVSLAGDFNRLFPSLTWLSCRDFSLEFEAKNFHPTNLAVLDLSCSDISEERIDWIRAARKLKVLDLSHYNNLTRTPDLSTWVFLERLILRRCSQLIEIGPSIGKLQSLVELDLSWTSIDHLPDSIGNLKQLKVLRLSRMGWMTKLSSAIGGLEKLKELDLSFTDISELPTMVSRLSNLQTLNLEECRMLKQLPELPPSLTCLRWTTETAIGSYESENHTTLPTSIDFLAFYFEKVQFLPQLSSSLRELQFRNLVTSRSLDFSNLKNLSVIRSRAKLHTIFSLGSEVLRMEFCIIRKLDALLQLEMERLRKLEMRLCDFLPEVLDLSHMKNLQEICLFVCKTLVEIRGLEELGALCSLLIEGCWSMERMSDLSSFTKLRKLIVRHCPKLRSVKGLNCLESLKELSIFNAGEFGVDTSNLNIEHSW